MKIQAIHNLYNNVAVIRGDDCFENDGTSVTIDQSLVDAEVTRLQAVYDSNAYQRTRANAYEEVKEQLDQLYHDMAANKGDKTGDWFAAVKAVKDATPKP